jgi:flagellar basal-body rod protein FlgB
VFDDLTCSALRVAASGLAMRQRVIANNIANIDTDNFRAGQVNFEQALGAAVAAGRDPALAGPSVSTSTESAGLNGNNVSLENEVLSNVETGLHYQLVLRALDGKFAQLRTAIKGA